MRTYRIAEWMSSPPIVVTTAITLADAQHVMERCHIESDLLRLLIAETIEAEHADPTRDVLICQHCGTLLRGRSFATIGPDDTCWHCHYHLHRCENCRYFDSIGCMLARPDRHTAIPGQQCPAFAYRSARDVGTSPDEPALL